ncbi:MAG: hypothetical protein Ta2E_13010 [Mycoplasmoidaceae bacterium]|nr:MAG: hypothetical protein Ta2E_13010 [Mycoplasmoidaceae bacterium]
MLLRAQITIIKDGILMMKIFKIFNLNDSGLNYLSPNVRRIVNYYVIMFNYDANYNHKAIENQFFYEGAMNLIDLLKNVPRFSKIYYISTADISYYISQWFSARLRNIIKIKWTLSSHKLNFAWIP